MLAYDEKYGLCKVNKKTKAIDCWLKNMDLYKDKLKANCTLLESDAKQFKRRRYAERFLAQNQEHLPEFTIARID